MKRGREREKRLNHQRISEAKLLAKKNIYHNTIREREREREREDKSIKAVNKRTGEL